MRDWAMFGVLALGLAVLWLAHVVDHWPDHRQQRTRRGRQ